ncbi:hypothetical protein sos41_20260 [Alphaproteobacteria bacterium SO-S41]|nr:hypothetical protein sos41_20260 [Alphaproteobacteria bacterium SO-S41]
MSVRIISLAAACALLSACATPAPPVAPVPVAVAPACPAGGSTMSKVELYFGLAIPGGGAVSKTEWQAFLDTEVTPRFPDGLSVEDVSGQWRDAATGKTVREPSRRIMILYTPSAEAETKIEAIRTAYKTRFRQDSVMRLDETDCVAF